jgi:hypothetical protein
MSLLLKYDFPRAGSPTYQLDLVRLAHVNVQFTIASTIFDSE